jgi:hypothetical protein
LLDSFKLLSPWINLHRKHKLKIVSGFQIASPSVISWFNFINLILRSVSRPIHR